MEAQVTALESENKKVEDEACNARVRLELALEENATLLTENTTLQYSIAAYVDDEVHPKSAVEEIDLRSEEEGGVSRGRNAKKSKKAARNKTARKSAPPPPASERPWDHLESKAARIAKKELELKAVEKERLQLEREEKECKRLRKDWAADGLLEKHEIQCREYARLKAKAKAEVSKSTADSPPTTPEGSPEERSKRFGDFDDSSPEGSSTAEREACPLCHKDSGKKKGHRGRHYKTVPAYKAN